MIITIDGILGAGKSTAARKLAKRLGFIHLNSGGLYRAVGLWASQKKVGLDDEKALIELANSLHFSFLVTPDGETDFVVSDNPTSEGESWTSKVLGEEVGSMASQIGVLAGLRAVLTEIQRGIVRDSILKNQGAVVEGRDSGTVVFPDAELKFFLTASLEERVKRRMAEGEGGVDVEALRKDIEIRDLRDSSRAASPLKIPDGAIVIDSSDKDADAVVGEMEEAVRMKSARR